MVREKSRKNKFFKVSERSGNSVFWFIVHKFFQDFEMHFLLEKMKSMLQGKQSNQFDTVRLTLCSSCGQWFLL